MPDQHMKDAHALSQRTIGSYTIFADWELAEHGQCAPVLLIRKASDDGGPPAVAFERRRLQGAVYPTATLARAHAMQYGMQLVTDEPSRLLV